MPRPQKSRVSAAACAVLSPVLVLLCDTAAMAQPVPEVPARNTAMRWVVVILLFALVIAASFKDAKRTK